MDEITNPKQLMTRAKQGDREAFQQVYTAYFLPVYRYIYKRVKNKQDAEDLTQSVFLKVYTSKTTFDKTKSSPLAYFFTAARNITTDHWKNKKRKEISTNEIHSGIYKTSITEKLDQKTTITQALCKLGQDQQKVLRMKFLEGYSNQDIAKNLNKTEPAIRQIQCRALKTLRRHFSTEKNQENI